MHVCVKYSLHVLLSRSLNLKVFFYHDECIRYMSQGKKNKKEAVLKYLNTSITLHRVLKDYK